jgi:hypothetical protein
MKKKKQMKYWDMSKGRRITWNGLMMNAINCWSKKNDIPGIFQLG